MGIAVLWASPDLAGITASAKERVIEGIRDAGIEAEEIHLNRHRIQCCLACGKGGFGRCLDGVCAIQDDVPAIYEKMRQSEALVFVTPVYWLDLSENFKALLDRIRRMETMHNGFLRGRQALLVACAGGSGAGTVQCLGRLEQTLAHIGIHTADRIPVERFNQEYMIPALHEAGRNFALKYNSFRFDDIHFYDR